jgi:octanoyl-[GcvH]:protein N-octanoyltransferase
VPGVSVRFHRGAVARADPAEQALELALAHALVRRASAGELDEAVRIHRPTRPVVVFGRRDTRLPGFPAAAAAARAAGFEPLVRATGGRAVAYTGAALVVDHVRHDTDAQRGQERRFEEFGDRFVEVFSRLGIEARVGAVPGEYCPGAHSVNARGVVKLVGTSQRVVRNAWLFSSLVVVGDEALLRPVLSEVYGHLGQEFDAASVGSLSGEVPGLEVDTVETALLQMYDVSAHEPLDDVTLELARELADQHRV